MALISHNLSPVISPQSSSWFYQWHNQPPIDDQLFASPQHFISEQQHHGPTGGHHAPISGHHAPISGHHKPITGSIRDDHNLFHKASSPPIKHNFESNEFLKLDSGSPFDDIPYYRNKSRKENNKSTNFVNYLPWVLSAFSLVQPPPQSPSINARNNRLYQSRIEKSGPLNIFYQWSQLDYAFESDVERNIAISSDRYIPENNLPLGIEAWQDRVFITIPRWKKGVPATLTWLPRTPTEKSPKLNPYPNWDWHSRESCDILTSVFRIFADSCGRLWVLDSGQVEVTINPRQICPPSIIVFDLKTDQLLLRYEIPEQYVKQDSLYTNIVVDIRENECDDAYAYVTDVWRYGILVYSLKTRESWRLTDGYFYPDPLYTKYQLNDLKFQWNDGIFGMALSPYQNGRGQTDRLLFYHPMSSSQEFYLPVSALRNETYFNNAEDLVQVLGESRGLLGQSSASGMTRDGVMFYNMVLRNSVGCWDSSKAYTRNNLGVVVQDNVTMVFPNDLKIDQEKRQSVWILSNKLPFYLYRSLDQNDINFRIFQGYTDEIVKGTICDPVIPDTHQHYPTLIHY